MEGFGFSRQLLQSSATHKYKSNYSELNVNVTLAIQIGKRYSFRIFFEGQSGSLLMSPLRGEVGRGVCLVKAVSHFPHFNQGLFLRDLKEEEETEQKTSHIKGKCLL